MKLFQKFFLVFTLLLITTVPSYAATNKINWLGQDWDVTGVNLPWLDWPCDFGTGCNNGGWQNGGVSVPENQTRLRAMFQQLKDNNIHTVRWWLFPENPSQNSGNNIGLNTSNGVPTTVHAAVYDDIDIAVQLAREYDLYYVFVFHSSPESIENLLVNSSKQQDTAKINALVNAYTQMMIRYKDEPHVLSWEIFNEPEFGYDEGKEYLKEPSRTFGKGIVNAKKTNNIKTLISVGNASIKMQDWTDIDFDFFSPHYYQSWMDPWKEHNPYFGDFNSSNKNTADSLRQQYGINKPILLGEAYTDLGQQGAVNHLNEGRRRNYAGVWGWSLNHPSVEDHFKAVPEHYKVYIAQHPDIGPRKGASPTAGPSPTPSITPTRTPTGINPSPTIPVSTPTESDDPNYTTSATITNAVPGQEATITATVSTSNFDDHLVDIEVYDEAGKKIFQKYFEDEDFQANIPRTFTVKWPIPANLPNGKYTIKIGIFDNSWDDLDYWNNEAGTFTIGAGQNCPRKPVGDANCDGKVNLSDLEIWRAEFIDEAVGTNADFNGTSNCVFHNGRTGTKLTCLDDRQIWTQTFLNGG